MVGPALPKLGAPDNVVLLTVVQGDERLHPTLGIPSPVRHRFKVEEDLMTEAYYLHGLR